MLDIAEQTHDNAAVVEQIHDTVAARLHDTVDAVEHESALVVFADRTPKVQPSVTIDGTQEQQLLVASESALGKT